MQAVDPAIDLPDPLRRHPFHALVGTQPQQPLEILPEGGKSSRLKRVNVVASIIFGDLESFSAGIQAVTAEANPQLRELDPQLLHQASQGLQLAILLDPFRAVPAGALATSWLSMNSLAIEMTVPAGPSTLASSTWCIYSVVSPCRWVRQSSQCRE